MLDNCCPETNAKGVPNLEHPFSSRYKRPNTTQDNVFNFKSPIPLEIIDPIELQRSWERLKIVPFLPDCGENILYFLKTMKVLSPTHGSCIANIKSYVFPSKIDVIRQSNSDFNFDETEEVSIADKKNFSKFIQTINTKGKSYRDLIEQSYDDYKDTGNNFIEAGVKKIGSVYYPFIHVLPVTSVKYKYTEPNEAKVVYISPRWDEDYIQKHKPRTSSVYPDLDEDKGSFRTIIHIKNGGHWYGLPDWINSFMHVYREFQDADYLIKQAANEFSGRVFIEVEEDDVESGTPFGDDSDAKSSGFQSVADRMQSNFSLSAEKPQTIMLSSRGAGAKPAFVFQFKPHTNSQFYKTSADINELKIIRSHQWSKRFLGENLTQGFSTNVFIDELRVKETGVLSYLRDKTTQGINIALHLISERLNSKWSDLSIRPLTPFENKYVIQAVEDNLKSKHPAVTDLKKKDDD